ncbi:MAG: alpha/beta hydrolase [Anaerolineae bacterium]|nr:alpha/beta hydrolase [Anaerolineae bacterium]
MSTQFANSPDGKYVAYDVCGSGPAVVLLHGGGDSRQEWYEAGYVERLCGEFTVITVDLRGHGESALPIEPVDYDIDKLVQDILTVADACGVERFALWGMSYGGKIGRYVAVRSPRVTKTILMGTPLGLGVSGVRRQEAEDFCAHWLPILQAQRDGTLDRVMLSPQDRELLQHLNIPVMLGWVRAMLDWPAVEPRDFPCPMLWLVGSEDEHAMDSVKTYMGIIDGSNVQVHFVEGLDHEQIFDEIDIVFPVMVDFTRYK